MGVFLGFRRTAWRWLRTSKGGLQDRFLKIPRPVPSETLCSAREASRFCMLLLLTNGEVRCSHSHSCCSLCINRLFGLGLMISVFLCFLTHNRSQTCDVVKISCSLESGKSRARSYHYLNGRFWTHFLMSLSLSFLISTIMLNLLTF